MQRNFQNHKPNNQATSKVSTSYNSKIKSTISEIQEPAPKKIRPFNALEYLYTGLKPPEILEIKGAFDTFDPDQTGEANVQEIKDAFTNLGFAQSSPYVLKLLEHINKKNKGVIQFREFIDISTLRVSNKWSREQSNRIFSLYDATDSGKCSLYDLQDIARDMGSHFNDQELERLFKKADTDQDGFISEQDFYYIITEQAREHEREMIKSKHYETMSQTSHKGGKAQRKF